MIVEGYEFSHIGDLEPMKLIDGSVKQFTPQNQYENTQKLLLNNYGEGPFCKFKISNKFSTSGVYIIIENEIKLYIGECVNLSKRFNSGYGNISPRNCFKGGQETNVRVNNLIYKTAMCDKKIALWFHQTTDYKNVEARLRRNIKTLWNLA